MGMPATLQDRRALGTVWFLSDFLSGQEWMRGLASPTALHKRLRSRERQWLVAQRIAGCARSRLALTNASCRSAAHKAVPRRDWVAGTAIAFTQ